MPRVGQLAPQFAQALKELLIAHDFAGVLRRFLGQRRFGEHDLFAL